VALALAGCGLIVMLVGTRGTLAATTWGVIAGLSFGGLILALDAVNRRSPGGRADVASVVLVLNAGAVVVLTPLGLSTGTLGLDLGAWMIAGMIGFGVVQMAAPYALFQSALRRVDPTRAALLVLLEPILNPVWTWLAVGETPDPATMIGGGLLLSALVVEALTPAAKVET
jgi:drug/metabolite transporter (DMT)-like permease